MKYRLSLWLIILIAATLLTPTAGAGPTSQQAGEWRTYPTQAPVTALIGDGDIIWVGTTNGLIRLNRQDGSSVTYTTADGLSDNAVSALALKPDGELWVGSRDGNISRFDGQNWRIMRLLEAPEDNVFLSAIGFDSLGYAWYSLYGYGIYWRDEHFTSANGLSDDYVLAMAFNGNIAWVGTRSGLNRYSPGIWSSFTKEDGLTSATITALAIDSLGQVWAGSYDGGVNRLDWQGWTGFTTAGGLPDNRINAIVIDAAGRPWVATPKGVSYLEGEVWTTYTSADGLAADNVKAMTVDDDGHLWFGTELGLTEFVPPPANDVAGVSGSPSVTSFTSADGLADDRVWTIATGPDGRTWFGTYDHGVSVFDGQSWSRYSESDGLAHNDVRAILMTADGDIWFGTGGGVSRFDGQGWRSYTTANGLASNGIEALAQDKAGHIWAAHLAEGVSRFDGANWTAYTVEDGLADNWVHAVAVDQIGRVWFGTNGGVSVFDGQAWTTFTVADGLVGDTVFALLVDARGHIWGGITEGLNEYDGSRWLAHLPDHPINDLALDREGAVWAVGSGLVSRFDGQQWLDYTPASFSGQDLRAVEAGPQGQVWLGSFGGGVSLLSLPAPVEAPLDFNGAWQSIDLNFPFGITLIQDGAQLKGWHCGALLDGSRTDCQPEDSPEYSIEGEVKGDVAYLHFISGYSGAAGQATLTPTADGLTWQISEPPAGEFYLPQQATLKKKASSQGTKLDLAATWTVLSDLGDTFTRLAAAPGGSIWSVNSTHLFQVEAEAWQVFDLPIELREKIEANPYTVSPIVTDLAAAADGAVWLSTHEMGLYHFAGGHWRHFTPAVGLPGETVLRLALDSQNHLWAIFMANEVYSLTRFDGQQWQSHPLPDISRAPTGLAVTPAGQIWLAVPGNPPFMFDGSQWQQPKEGWQAGSFDIFVAASPSGTVWFGSDKSWQRWTGQHWQMLEVSIPAPFSFPAAVDANGGAWGIVTPFCYWCKLPNLNENGAVYVTPEQSCRFTAADGLGDPPLEPPPLSSDLQVKRPDVVKDIALAGDGRVWFITQGKLTVFNPPGSICDEAAPENVRQNH